MGQRAHSGTVGGGYQNSKESHGAIGGIHGRKQLSSQKRLKIPKWKGGIFRGSKQNHRKTSSQWEIEIPTLKRGKGEDSLAHATGEKTRLLDLRGSAVGLVPGGNGYVSTAGATTGGAAAGQGKTASHDVKRKTDSLFFPKILRI